MQIFFFFKIAFLCREIADFREGEQSVNDRILVLNGLSIVHRFIMSKYHGQCVFN